ncbi:MAG: HepT-like ribonuclease domain-containing protein [Candidatus Hodarchaeota archaeon]
MTRLTHKLTHTYFGVRLELVWNTASELLPPLKKVFQQISFELESNNGEEE